jgi:hypothetical protein
LLEDEAFEQDQASRFDDADAYYRPLVFKQIANYFNITERLTYKQAYNLADQLISM